MAGKSNTSLIVIAIVVPIIAFVILVILILIYLRMRRSREHIEGKQTWHSLLICYLSIWAFPVCHEIYMAKLKMSTMVATHEMIKYEFRVIE